MDDVVAVEDRGFEDRFRTSLRNTSERRYAFPPIGRVPVSEVTSVDVLEVLAPIWHAKAETARWLHQCIRTVLEWAVAMAFCNRQAVRPARPGPEAAPKGLHRSSSAGRFRRLEPYSGRRTSLAR